MGRIQRHHLPGVAFHITARIQGKAAHFKGVERLIASRIRSAPIRSDARVLAFAVMPNHLHLVVLQGRRPLAALMQPLLSRLAVLIRNRCGAEGHVFERRFRSHACLDPDYFRNAIAYVHLNGYRAGLCNTFDAYSWCSHTDYVSIASQDCPAPRDLAIERAVRVFASSVERSTEDCVADYLSFLRWRSELDAYQRSSNHFESSAPTAPPTCGGDIYWHRHFAAAAADGHTSARRKPDLSEIAAEAIVDMAPEMDVELLRQGSRAKPVVRVRQRFILRASEEGYAGARIADYLHVSPTTVSLVLRGSRNREHSR